MTQYLLVQVTSEKLEAPIDCYQAIENGYVVGYVSLKGEALKLPDVREEVVQDPEYLEGIF